MVAKADATLLQRNRFEEGMLLEEEMAVDHGCPYAIACMRLWSKAEKNS